MFFSGELAEPEVERFVGLLRENDGETPVLDVRDLPRQVPLPALLGEGPERRAPWPAFVLGGREDAIVDERACLESAEWLGIPGLLGNSGGEGESSGQRRLVMIDGLAHDCMLDARWREAADALLEWAEGV